MDDGKIPVTIFLDLSKAFDTLDHGILLEKLNFYGIQNTSLEWFKSYLKNRHQFVDYDGEMSQELPVLTGVPQGSILGPLLFLIYMNDINKATEKFHAILFADDSTLVSSLCYFLSNSSGNLNVASLSRNINIELGKICEWLQLNKLSLNVGKTKYMLFHHHQRNISKLIPTLEINNQQIELVSEFNFLGLTIDKHLNWKSHSQKVSNTVSRSLGVLCRLKKFLPMHILQLLYNSLIQPHLQYCILAWGLVRNRLEKLQKRAIRIITCSRYNAHTEPLFKKMKLLKLSDIFDTNLLKLYFKYEHRLLPEFFLTNFFENMPNHRYPSRKNSSQRLPLVKTAHGQRRMPYVVANTLNNTTDCIIEKIATHSYRGFSIYCKNYILSKYEENCLKASCYICKN